MSFATFTFANTFRPFNDPSASTFLHQNFIKGDTGKYGFTQKGELTIRTPSGSSTGKSTTNETMSSGMSGGTATIGTDPIVTTSNSGSFTNSIPPPQSYTAQFSVFDAFRQHNAFKITDSNSSTRDYDTTYTTVDGSLTKVFTSFTRFLITSRNIGVKYWNQDYKNTTLSFKNTGQQNFGYYQAAQDYYQPVGVLVLSKMVGDTTPSKWYKWNDIAKRQTESTYTISQKLIAFPGKEGPYGNTISSTNKIRLNIKRSITTNAIGFTNGGVGKTTALLTQEDKYQYVLWGGNPVWEGVAQFTYWDTHKYFAILNNKLEEFTSFYIRTTSAASKFQLDIPASTSFVSVSGSNSVTQVITGEMMSKPPDKLANHAVIEMIQVAPKFYSSGIKPGFIDFNASVTDNTPIYTDSTYNIVSTSGGSFQPYFPGYSIFEGVRAFTSHSRGYDTFFVTGSIYGRIRTSTTALTTTRRTSVSQIRDFENSIYDYSSFTFTANTTTADFTTVTSATSSFRDTIYLLEKKTTAAKLIFSRENWDGKTIAMTANVFLRGPLNGNNRFVVKDVFVGQYVGGFNPIQEFLGVRADYTMEFFQGNWYLTYYNSTGKSGGKTHYSYHQYGGTGRSSFTLPHKSMVYWTSTRLYRPQILDSFRILAGIPSDPLEGISQVMPIYDEITAPKLWVNSLSLSADSFSTYLKTYYKYVNGF